MRLERSFDASATPSPMGTAPWIRPLGSPRRSPNPCLGTLYSRRHHCGTPATRDGRYPDSPHDSTRNSLGYVDGDSLMVQKLGLSPAETEARSERGRGRLMPRRNSGRGAPPKAATVLDLSPPELGHSSPQCCPPHCPQRGDANPLGAPLSIREVAALIGCSTWTIRQKYLPLGLPHFRVGPTGKLLFYKTLVIRWLIRRQKGRR